nr:phosphate signaling complex protein PhoU [Actinomyces sp. 432]
MLREPGSAAVTGKRLNVRDIFNQELKQLGTDLASMAAQVATAIERAAESLRTGDIIVAEQVIDADERINDLQRDIDDMCVMLLARQQPVDRDLRNVISALRMAQTLERQGDLARHVAAIARGRYPQAPVPEPVLGLMVKMADAAVRAGRDVCTLIETQDLELAAAIQRRDAELDALHRESFQMILDPAIELSRQQVVDAVLMGRFLERFGDHSTSVARRMAYLVSGITVPGPSEA